MRGTKRNGGPLTVKDEPEAAAKNEKPRSGKKKADKQQEKEDPKEEEEPAVMAPPPPKQKRNGKKKTAEDEAGSENGSFSEGSVATPSPRQKRGKKKNGDIQNQPRKSIDSMDEAPENANGNEAASTHDSAEEVEADDMPVSSETIDSTYTVETPSGTEPEKLTEEKSEPDNLEDVAKNDKSKKGKKEGRQTTGR